MNVPPSLQRLIHSFTSLNTYLNCPHQYAARFIYKSVPFVESEAIKFGSAVHSAMERRLAKDEPLPSEFARWEAFAAPVAALKETHQVRIELRYGVTQSGECCGWDGSRQASPFLRGKVDVAVSSDSTGYILDWKTGRPWEKPFELEIGAIFLKSIYVDLKQIVGQYAWLKEDRMGVMHDLSDTAATMRQVQTIAQEIERDRSLGQWEKREGPLCAYCPVKLCEHNRSEL